MRTQMAREEVEAQLADERGRKAVAAHRPVEKLEQTHLHVPSDASEARLGGRLGCGRESGVEEQLEEATARVAGSCPIAGGSIRGGVVQLAKARGKEQPNECVEHRRTGQRKEQLHALLRRVRVLRMEEMQKRQDEKLEDIQEHLKRVLDAVAAKQAPAAGVEPEPEPDMQD